MRELLRPSQPAPAFADGIVVAFLICLGLIALPRVLEHAASGGEMVLGVGYLAALVALQVWCFRRADSLSGPSAVLLVLAVQATLVFLPFVHLPWWRGLPGILGGSLLLLLRPAVGALLFVAVILSVGWVAATATSAAGVPPSGALFVAVFESVTTLMSGLAVYGLTRLAEQVRALHQTRDDLARLAVADQRLRFAQDLQDLLGARLSAIAARTERVRSAPPTTGTGEVQRALGEVLETCRTALADVRSVARGYRRLLLGAELAEAQSVLAAAEVAVVVERDDGEPDEAVGTVLAVVLREAVTNILRSGDVRLCTIELRHDAEGIRLEVVHDGADPHEPGSAAEADGISAMARQVRELGGELTACVESDRCRLVVTVPSNRPEPGDEETEERLPALRRRLANAIVAAAFVCFGTIILADVLINQRDAQQAALGVGYLAIVLGLQMGYFIRPSSLARPGLSLAALAVQACFVYLPVVQYGGLWLTMPSFLAANALLVLRPALSVPLTVAVLASVSVFVAGENPDPLWVAGYVVWALTNVVVVYGLTRLARLTGELHAARGELARMAVAEEQLRFARDVHDLLGLSLSAVTLKAELANRLLPTHPERAREQLGEIVALSRKAIGDVRSVASGYQEFQLDEELRSARSVLTSAEIDVQISGFDFEIPEPQSAVLATVAREGVTNVLRHSKAERCEITVHRAPGLVLIDIVNDGLTRDGLDRVSSDGGNGIRNLTHRVGAVGGDLTVGVEPNGTFRLRATVPLHALI